MAIQKFVGAAQPPNAAYAELAVAFYRGEVQYHKAGRTRATQLRRRGRVNGAANDRHIEYKHFVRCAYELAGIIGVDGGTGIKWIDDYRRAAWARACNTLLAAARSGIQPDSPLPVGKAMLYMVTRGPRKGAAFELFIYHKANLQHSRKMLKYARLLQRKKLEDQARELLCKERDRCISLSFPPEVHYRPM